jgi:hypothetical protein
MLLGNHYRTEQCQFMSPASMLTSKGFATVVDLDLNGTLAFDGYMGEHGGRIVNIVAETRNGIPHAMHTVRHDIAARSLNKSHSMPY